MIKMGMTAIYRYVIIFSLGVCHWDPRACKEALPDFHFGEPSEPLENAKKTLHLKNPPTPGRQDTKALVTGGKSSNAGPYEY